MYWEIISEEKLIQPSGEDNLKDIEPWGGIWIQYGNISKTEISAKTSYKFASSEV
jgi:hypothetical protein